MLCLLNGSQKDRELDREVERERTHTALHLHPGNTVVHQLNFLLVTSQRLPILTFLALYSPNLLHAYWDFS